MDIANSTIALLTGIVVILLLFSVAVVAFDLTPGWAVSNVKIVYVDDLGNKIKLKFDDSGRLQSYDLRIGDRQYVQSNSTQSTISLGQTTGETYVYVYAEDPPGLLFLKSELVDGSYLVTVWHQESSYAVKYIFDKPRTKQVTSNADGEMAVMMIIQNTRLVDKVDQKMKELNRMEKNLNGLRSDILLMLDRVDAVEKQAADAKLHSEAVLARSDDNHESFLYLYNYTRFTHNPMNENDLTQVYQDMQGWGAKKAECYDARGKGGGLYDKSMQEIKVIMYDMWKACTYVLDAYEAFHLQRDLIHAEIYRNSTGVITWEQYLRHSQAISAYQEYLHINIIDERPLKSAIELQINVIELIEKMLDSSQLNAGNRQAMHDWANWPPTIDKLIRADGTSYERVSKSYPGPDRP